MSEFLSKEEGNKLLDKITWDLIRPTRSHKGLELWIVVLGLIMIAFGYAYFIQLRDGLGVTAMRDFVSWGMYIGNFVFFVAVSLVGFLITAVLGLLKFKWIEPISRIAEIVALAFVMVAGLVIVFDMGRPDRLHHVLIYGRFQSPILWDITVITTYLVISLLLFLLPLIPDMAIAAQRVKNLPTWQKKLYEILSFGFKHKPEQYKIIKKGIRILSILIMPVALAIHTVTSWLFASTLRPGWDTTIFGPYFVTGAFVAGAAAVIVMMGIFRSNFKLKDYIKEEHFDQMGKLLVFVSLVYLYFNVNEYLVPGYKMKEGDNEHLMGLFTGHWAPMFWTSQILGLIVPIILPLFKKFRTPKALTIISVLVVIGAWLKRYIIVVPTMLHPHLPIQNVPEEYATYIPTGAEILVTLGTFGLTFIIITVLSKVFPVVPIWEVAKEKGVDLENIND
jgi:molybdopterin-containing oxidoreductase family membrane subunit